MYEILTLNKIAKCGLDQLSNDKYTITDNQDANADGIILRSFSMHEMELGDKLLAVARAGAGTNNIPIDKCTEKGVVVFNTPGANANAVKELVVLGLLMASRDVAGGIEWAKGLSGDDVGKQVEKGKSSFAGCEIKGKTLGVIGLGAIGILVANAAEKLGMKVIGYDPYLSVDAAWKLSSHIEKAKNVEDVYKKSDYISVHVPFTPDTKHMINKDAFALMKDGVKVLNFSRAELVNNDDIKEAIKSGKVSCYVVDFPNSETVNQEKIVAIPHLGASTEESEDNCATMAAQELAAYIETGDILNSVNFPNCSLQMSNGGRISILHKNVPNMIGQFTNIFAEAGLNIADMINKSKKDNAATIINSDGEIPETVFKKISEIDGVLKVRVIK